MIQLSIFHAGLCVAAPLLIIGLWALLATSGWQSAVKAFPRNRPAAWVLTALALGWSAMLINDMPLGGLNHLKTYLWVAGPVAFFLLAIYLDELLASRSLGGLMLLSATPLFDSARWYETDWRLALVIFGYALFVVGCFFVATPWRFRRWLEKPAGSAASAKRFGAVMTGLGVFFAAVALAVYRSLQ
jgi:hypothetical protein